VADRFVRDLVAVPRHGQLSGAARAAGELWFVLGGAGQIRFGAGQALPLGPDHGVWLPGGTDYEVRAGGAPGLRVDVVALPAGTTGQAADVPLVARLGDCAVETTGDRRFRVLFGPGRGCAPATQFVGEIPPGRAPEHRHPYDEVVLVLAGAGVAHVAGGEVAITVGSSVHLPPGTPHCLENTGTVTLRVLGVFHPADSPAAKLKLVTPHDKS
jgi:mannose-6-phosphate isomerase-like protein (cupin superfamily)